MSGGEDEHAPLDFEATDAAGDDAGRFFLSLRRSPERIVDVQRNRSTGLLNEYIRHIGSGVWAIPPGAHPGSFVGAGLFA